MKPSILLLTVCLFGFIITRANSTKPDQDKVNIIDLNGTVVSSDTKKPLKDVSVTVYSISRKEKVIVTNKDGNFSLDELKPGIYKVIFEKIGFKKVTKDKVVVKSDEAFQLNIEMIQSNDFDLMPSPFHFLGVK